MKSEKVHCSTEYDYSCDLPRLRFADGGRLLKLSFARSQAADWNAEHFCSRGGIRGKCKGFSFGSRRRMLNSLNSVSVAATLPYFFTATLPDEVFCDSVTEFAASAKTWMDTFLKRLRRRVPQACGFWRIEWQSRKSGRYEGKLVPHFHLLIWGLPQRLLGTGRDGEEIYEAFVPCPDHQLSLELLDTLSERPGSAGAEVSLSPGERRSITPLDDGRSLVFRGTNKFVSRCETLHDKVLIAQMFPEDPKRVDAARNMSFGDWASLAWYHVVGSHNVAHLKAGSRVERVKTWGGVMTYCAKYMAKEDCNFLSDVSFGRSWGVFNRAAVPWAKVVELNLDTDIGVRLRRVARHYLERRFGRRVRAPYGITLYCDVSQFRKFWECGPAPPF